MLFEQAEHPEGLTMWTDDKIRKKVEEFEKTVGWYQDIDLGNGIHTKTRSYWGEDLDHPRLRWDEVAKAVPDDLTGMAVLDIGCNAGYFSFEAKMRGADYVCGIDLKQGYVNQAKFCADVKGMKVDFRTLSIYDLDTIGKTFDLVFCVGILYHCKYFYKAVEQAASATKKIIIVESAIYRSNRSFLPQFLNRSKETAVVRFVGYSRAQGKKLPGHWHPSIPALKELFLEQGFSDVETLFIKGGRGGIVAKR
jgi:2-polyprenyl-3-methyl-5-hydroxy-6-metoxy-1,4-benzoquinol methylase